MRVFWTTRALDDLLAIRETVRVDLGRPADRLVGRLVSRSEQLAQFERSGRVVPEFGRESVREILESPYRLIYRIGGTRLDVVAVIHERQRLPPDVGRE